MNLKEMLEAMLLAQYNYYHSEHDSVGTNAFKYRQARTDYMVACADYVAGLIADGTYTYIPSGADGENAGAPN
jgi:hypothetical protein